MTFGLDNNAKIVLKRGRVFHSRILIHDIHGEIQELEKGETWRYVYFGTKESGSV